MAIGSNREILVYSSHCFGVKSDLSLELDVVLGAWTSINDIAGRTTAVGLGADTGDFENESGTEETGANFELMFNSEKVVGGTFSVGYGYGYNLPIDYEINFDICQTTELMRLNWKIYLAR